MSWLFDKHKYKDPKLVADMSLRDIRNIKTDEITTETMNKAIDEIVELTVDLQLGIKSEVERNNIRQTQKEKRDALSQLIDLKKFVKTAKTPSMSLNDPLHTAPPTEEETAIIEQTKAENDFAKVSDAFDAENTSIKNIERRFDKLSKGGKTRRRKNKRKSKRKSKRKGKRSIRK